MVNVSPARPRVLVLLPMGWCIRNYLHSGFLARLKRTMHVSVAVRFQGEPLDSMLRPVVDELHTIPDVPVTGPLFWVESAMIRAHLYRHDTQAFRSRRGIMWRNALGAPKTIPNLVFLEASGLTLSRLPPGLYAKAVAMENRLAIACYQGSGAKDLLDRARPDVVFSTVPQYHIEWPIVRLARKRQIPIATSILSWDNLAKGRFPEIFDRYYVWSDVMARDLRGVWPQVAESSIVVSGTPQFDLHVRGREPMSRADFFRRLSLEDPARPLVTYMASTTAFPVGEEVIVRDLALALRDGKVPGKPQLLVRLHPLDDGARFVGLEKLGVRVVRPWAADPRSPSWSYPTAQDMEMLWGTLAHTAVSLNFASTTTLDFSVFHKPVINVAIETAESRARRVDIPGAYAYEHYRRVLDNKAVRLVTSMDELLLAIQDYLENPTADEEGRARLVREVCARLDGHAGERIADDLSAFRQWPSVPG